MKIKLNFMTSLCVLLILLNFVAVSKILWFRVKKCICLKGEVELAYFYVLPGSACLAFLCEFLIQGHMSTSA